MPRKKSQPWILIPTLFFVGALLLLSNWKDLAEMFTTQLLQSPEIITPIKLIKAGTDPVAFDVFMADLINPQPQNFQITLREVQTIDGLSFSSGTDYSPVFTANTGDVVQSKSGDAHVFSVSNVQQQNTTKLGRISTTISESQYISLSYDILRNGQQESVKETPLPTDFPVGYHLTNNPTPELLYVRTPRLHSILGPSEKLFTKVKKIDHGALLVENTLTTYQKLSDITIDQITNEGAQVPSAELQVHQQQIIVPPESTRLFDTLIIRFRKGSEDWSYSPHLLTSSPNIRLPIPPQSLLDFYTEVQYSYAYLGNGYQTMNASFPFNSFLQVDEFAAVYRHEWEDLTPALEANRSALPFELSVIPPSSDEGVFIGFTSPEKITGFSEAIHYLRQQLPALVFSSDTKNLLSFADSQGSFFNLVGGEQIIWSQDIKQDTLDFQSPSFPPISEEDNIDEADMVLCFIETDQQSYSLGVYEYEGATDGVCALNAKRSGFDSGKIFVFRANMSSQSMLLQSSFDYLREDVPTPARITGYSEDRVITLDTPRANNSFSLQVSPDISFESFQTAALTRQSSISFIFAEAIPNCSGSCFIRLAEQVSTSSGSYTLGSAPLSYSPKNEEYLQLCFNNLKELEDILTPADLSFQISTANDDGPELSYISASGCYEYLPDPDDDLPSLSTFASTAGNNALPPQTITIHTNGLVSNALHIPPQRHYASLENGSLQQLINTELLFEYYRLDLTHRELANTSLTDSQVISGIANQASLQVYPMGNILIHKRLRQPIFFERLDVAAPLNESLLFPQQDSDVKVPHLIKIIRPSEIIDQSVVTLEKGKLFLPLDLPAPSDLKVFIKNALRQDVSLSTSISNIQVFSPQSGFLQFQNADGALSFDLSIEKPLATDTAAFTQTTPPTPTPPEANLFSFKTPLVIDINNELSSRVGESEQSPLFLPTAVPDQPYLQNLPITQGTVKRLNESQFSSSFCAQVFSLDPTELTVEGTLSSSDQLSLCTFFVSLSSEREKGPITYEYARKRYYAIPILSQETSSAIQTLSVALDKGADVATASVNLSPLQERFSRTDKTFSTAESSLSPYDDLSISYDPITSLLELQGSASELNDSQTLYFRAIDAATGLISRYQLRIVLATVQDTQIDLTRGFPNQVNIPVLLRELDFTEQEIPTLQLSPSNLPPSTSIDSQTGILTIPADSDLDGEAFSVQLTSEDGDLIRVDFEISLTDPQESTLETKNLSTDTNFSINLSALIPESQSFIVPELPSWISQSGNILRGKTPSDSLAITLRIQDLDNARIFLLPLTVTGDTITESPPETPNPLEQGQPTPSENEGESGEDSPSVNGSGGEEDPDEEGTLKSASDTTCFPDISQQPVEYQQAICLGKRLNIISGSGGLFKPDDSINRAEIAKVLVSGPLVLFDVIRSNEINQLSNIFSRQTFADVPQTAWFHGFVETIKELQIVDGFQDGSFKPGNSLTRAEASKMIVNTIAQLSPGSLAGADILRGAADPSEPWFTRFVNVLNTNGGNMPEPNEFEELGANISRAQFVYNLMIVLDNVAAE